MGHLMLVAPLPPRVVMKMAMSITMTIRWVMVSILVFAGVVQYCQRVYERLLCVLSNRCSSVDVCLLVVCEVVLW